MENEQVDRKDLTCGSWFEYVAIIIQQDAAICSLFISVNCSTYFGWYLHPSSGAQVTVSTVSGINETVTATCLQRDNFTG